MLSHPQKIVEPVNGSPRPQGCTPFLLKDEMSRFALWVPWDPTEPCTWPSVQCLCHC
jgi:hypothetical protein